ncbi:MAG TPA: sensor histidine kinase [Candidatus Acidoferrales bacterium]|nr:sensor histidine kinase [Candidatus Acidoferrales bacterium]
MSAEAAARRQVENLVNVARPVALLLTLLALKESAGDSATRSATIFLSGYLAIAIALVVVERTTHFERIRLPPEIDALVLVVFVALTPSLASFWFFYLFAIFAVAVLGRTGRSNTSRQSLPGNLFASDAGLLSAGAAIAVAIRAGWFSWAGQEGLLHWIGFAVGTYLAGLCVAWLGIRGRAQIGEDRFIESLLGTIRVEKGLAESVRLVLSEIAREFDCKHAMLVICDEEIDRLFVWKGEQDRRHAFPPDALPLTRAGAYLAEDLSQNVCWNSMEGKGRGFGWPAAAEKPRETGATVKPMEVPPAAARQELGADRVMAVTILSSGHPTGRMILVNSRRPFTRSDLRWFERIVRHLNVPLENVFLLRSLRARAVEAERSRISRDLHDGILQTLLSLNIQFGVLRRKLPQAPEQVGSDLATLEKTVREEGDDLRQMVKDLRPLRVESADLREMMHSFAERCHDESGVVVDLFLEENDLRAPDRICREVFQIYRESLNNIKKHARASHVVVKLWQDDTKIFLVVDDNGQGFSFAGKFGSEELDRLRLGPISIKERTRTVGGVLTVESNPGHGARLTIEIPLN